MKSRVLVTGSTGFVGRNLVPRLVDEFEVFAHSKSQRHYPELLGASLISGNLSEISTELLENTESIIHLASNGVNQDVDYDIQDLYMSNVHEPYKMIINALNANVKRILYISSCFEFGYTAISKGRLSVEYALMPQTQYAATKAALTTLLYPLCNYYNADIYNIKAFNLYGPHEKYNRLYPSVKRAIKKRQVLDITHGSQVKYFSHVDTIVDRMIEILKTPHKGSYYCLENHSRGQEMSVYTFVRSLFEEAGLNPSEYIRRSKVSRPNEPQFLTPQLNSSISYFGEPQS